MGLKLIVTGGRNLHDYEYIHNTLDKIDQHSTIAEIVHGGAQGVDFASGEWGYKNNKTVTVYRANWQQFGKAAGPIRNKVMLEDNLDADYLLAFPGGKGTANMCDLAKKAGLDVIRVAKPRGTNE